MKRKNAKKASPIRILRKGEKEAPIAIKEPKMPNEPEMGKIPIAPKAPEMKKTPQPAKEPSLQKVPEMKKLHANAHEPPNLPKEPEVPEPSQKLELSLPEPEEESEPIELTPGEEAENGEIQAESGSERIMTINLDEGPETEPEPSPLSSVPQLPSPKLDNARAIEAALFMSAKPLSKSELAKLIGSGSLGLVDTVISELQTEYIGRKSAIEISSDNGFYSMRLRAEYSPQTKQFAKEAEISKHALKTLAIISKNEGITKRKLFLMLGSTIYSDCAELEENGFVSHKKAGRTSSLHTTPKFKDYFGQ